MAAREGRTRHLEDTTRHSGRRTTARSENQGFPNEPLFHAPMPKPSQRRRARRADLVPYSAIWRCKVRRLTAICLATLSSDGLPASIDWASNCRKWPCQLTGVGAAVPSHLNRQLARRRPARVSAPIQHAVRKRPEITGTNPNLALASRHHPPPLGAVVPPRPLRTSARTPCRRCGRCSRTPASTRHPAGAGRVPAVAGAGDPGAGLLHR